MNDTGWLPGFADKSDAFHQHICHRASEPAEHSLFLRGSFGRLLRIAVTLLLLSLMMPVLASGETWEFCGTNSDMSPAKQCFDSREKAKAWIRTDPASGPRGRKYLEQDSPAISSSFLSNGLITFNYSIKPRGPKEVRNDDYGNIQNIRTGNQCFCDTSGQVKCYGEGPCPPGGCEFCQIPIGNIDIFKNHLLQPSPGMCNLRIEGETGYASPPISSNDLIYFPNTQQYAPDNYGYFNYDSGSAGWYKEFTRKYETTSSGCQTTYSSTYKVKRRQIFICDNGFRPKSGQINWRGGTADPYYHVEYSEICQNSLKASITARKIATKPQQCPAVGNPCDPVTGAKTQHESDLADTGLPLRRSYNSLRSASAYYYFGPGWHFNYAEKLLRYTGTPGYMLRITDEGMTERYDWSADRNAYVSVTQRDALIRAAGTEWELLLPAANAEYSTPSYDWSLLKTCSSPIPKSSLPIRDMRRLTCQQARSLRSRIVPAGACV